MFPTVALPSTVVKSPLTGSPRREQRHDEGGRRVPLCLRHRGVANAEAEGAACRQDRDGVGGDGPDDGPRGPAQVPVKFSLGSLTASVRIAR